jgi:hypothetical protein
MYQITGAQQRHDGNQPARTKQRLSHAAIIRFGQATGHRFQYPPESHYTRDVISASTTFQAPPICDQRACTVNDSGPVYRTSYQ